MGDCVSSFLEGDLGELLGDNRPCECGAEQIVLVDGTHLEARDDYVIDHLVNEVCDYELAGSGFDGFFLEAFEFIDLTYVTGYGYDLRVIVVFL